MKMPAIAIFAATFAGHANAFDIGNGLSVTPSAVIAWDVENEVPAHALKVTGGYLFESGASLSVVAEYDVQNRGTSIDATYAFPFTPNVIGFSTITIDPDGGNGLWIVGMEVKL